LTQQRTPIIDQTLEKIKYLAESKRKFNNSTESKEDTLMFLQAKFAMKKIALQAARDYNFINGSKEGIARISSPGRYRLIPERQRYDYNGHCKPDYLKGIEENASIFRRQNGDNTNFAD
jgi:uncharacterized protein YaiL (DUF2058 family)